MGRARFVVTLAVAAMFLAEQPVCIEAATAASQKLKHLIFIIQENRSFDHYFGTFPGADGLPNPRPCLPSMRHPGKCYPSFLNHAQLNEGGPLLQGDQLADIDGGKMDGFAIQRERQLAQLGCPTDELDGMDPDVICHVGGPGDVVDIMGFHDERDIPNYWAYAKTFVLQDHFFESQHSWSMPAHLAIFSGWSAYCTVLSPPDVNSCSYSNGVTKAWDRTRPTPYLWTDITYLLHRHNVTWGVYLDGGQGPTFGNVGVQAIWNVLPGFEDVRDDGQLGNALYDLKDFFAAAKVPDGMPGALPSVVWILPQFLDSEHPSSFPARGQAYVTKLINAVGNGPAWNSSAIFVTYDDFGGFYDHVPPPTIDGQGLGIRLPAWMVSPYAKKHYIDHQILSTDSYLHFIEDVFVNGKRLDPAFDGRPDPRPDVRDASPLLGDLKYDFNFQQPPRPPLILNPNPYPTVPPVISTPAPRRIRPVDHRR